MSLPPSERDERRRLMQAGHTAQTSRRLDELNRELNGSKTDSEVLRELSERRAAGQRIGQLAAEALRRGLSF